MNIDATIDRRLGRWREMLREARATPILLVSLIHHPEGDHSVLLNTLTRIDDETVSLMLAEAARRVHTGEIRHGREEIDPDD